MTSARVSHGVAVLVACLFAGCESGGGDETSRAPESLPAVATATPSTSASAPSTVARLVGSWAYSTSNQTVSGACPRGEDATGKLTITRSDRGLELTFVSGRVCSPASMCSFRASLDGITLSATNGDLVDDEGGKASNRLTLTVSMVEGTMTGKGSSTYQHPGGMNCEWSYDIEARRSD